MHRQNKRIKTGGRTEGTPNKLTSEIRDSLTEIVLSEIDSYKDTEDLRQKRKHLENLKCILPYVCPRPTPTNDIDYSPVIIQIAENI
jgi:hypothetical protein